MEEMYSYLKNVLKDKKGFEPQNILDVGAWNGFWTKNCRTFWPNAHYTCVEAGSKHLKKLQECADEVHIAVVGDTHKKIEMHLTKVKPNKVGYTKGSSIFPWEASDEQTEPRDMVTLESLVGEEAHYDLIKQDVQGAEILVMQGAKGIFKKATYIINEVNLSKKDKLPNIDEMNDYMLTMGFVNNEIIARHPGHDQVDVLYYK